MVFLIAYDLRAPNGCHLEESVWLVESALNATEIRELVQPAVHATDALFVARLQGNWSSWSLGNERNKWLQNRTF
jgi:hypothetical protein